jgi:hypothetical protein
VLGNSVETGNAAHEVGAIREIDVIGAGFEHGSGKAVGIAATGLKGAGRIDNEFNV